MWVPIDRPVSESESSFRILFHTRAVTYLHDNNEKEIHRPIQFDDPISYEHIDKEIHYLTNDDDLAPQDYLLPWTPLHENYIQVQPPLNTHLTHNERIKRLQLVCAALSHFKQDAIWEHTAHSSPSDPPKRYTYHALYTLWIYYVVYLCLLIFLFYYTYSNPSIYIFFLCVFFSMLGIVSVFI